MSSEIPNLIPTQQGRSTFWRTISTIEGEKVVHTIVAKVEGIAGSPLPVIIVEPGAVGVPKNFVSQGNPVTSPGGAEQVLISQAVPAGKTWDMSAVIVICRAHGKFRVYDNGALIASGNTGPGNPNATFPWRVSRSIAAGRTIEVKFEASTGEPPVSIDAYLMAVENT